MINLNQINSKHSVRFQVSGISLSIIYFNSFNLFYSSAKQLLLLWTSYKWGDRAREIVTCPKWCSQAMTSKELKHRHIWIYIIMTSTSSVFWKMPYWYSCRQPRGNIIFLGWSKLNKSAYYLYFSRLCFSQSSRVIRFTPFLWSIVNIISFTFSPITRLNLWIP